MNKYSPFGAFNVRKRREARVLPIPMADAIGISVEELSRAELGEMRVPENWLTPISEFLSLSEFETRSLGRSIRRSNSEYEYQRDRENFATAAFHCPNSGDLQ